MIRLKCAIGIDATPLQVTVSTADQEQQQEQDRWSIFMFVYCRYMHRIMYMHIVSIS